MHLLSFKRACVATKEKHVVVDFCGERNSSVNCQIALDMKLTHFAQLTGYELKSEATTQRMRKSCWAPEATAESATQLCSKVSRNDPF